VLRSLWQVLRCGRTACDKRRNEAYRKARGCSHGQYSIHSTQRAKDAEALATAGNGGMTPNA